MRPAREQKAYCGSPGGHHKNLLKKKNFALYLSGMGSPWEGSEPGDWYLTFILIRSLLWRIHKGPMESRKLMDFVIIQLYLLNGTFSSLNKFSPFCCSFPFYSTPIITLFLFNTFIYNLWALEFFNFPFFKNMSEIILTEFRSSLIHYLYCDLLMFKMFILFLLTPLVSSLPLFN